jgi:hypothetical protein
MVLLQRLICAGYLTGISYTFVILHFTLLLFDRKQILFSVILSYNTPNNSGFYPFIKGIYSK